MFDFHKDIVLKSLHQHIIENKSYFEKSIIRLTQNNTILINFNLKNEARCIIMCDSEIIRLHLKYKEKIFNKTTSKIKRHVKQIITNYEYSNPKSFDYIINDIVKYIEIHKKVVF